MLVACGSNDTAKDDQNTVAEKENTNTQEHVSDDSKEKDTDKQQEKSNKEKAENSEKNTSIPNIDLSGAEGVFKKATDAASKIKGMSLTGKINSTTDMMGLVTEEFSQITGEVWIDPFVQHLTMDNESTFNGVTEKIVMEMYLSGEAMYMTDSQSGKWLSFPMGQGDLSSIITEARFDYFASHHDSFELSEDKDHYILTLTGSGDELKKIVFGAIKEFVGEEAYQSITKMIKDISGTYELIIDKDTFNMVALKMDLKQTIDTGLGETKIVEQIYYEYSNFNKIDKIVVPDEVINNAQSLNMPSTGGVNE